MDGKVGYKGRLETADFCDLYLFDQGNLIFIMEKSGRGQGTLKTDLCGNHESFFVVKLESWTFLCPR